MRRAIFPAALAWAALSVPGQGWELIKQANSATTYQEQGSYLLSVSCQRGRNFLEFALNDKTLRGDAFQDVSAVMMWIIAPDGRIDKWSIPVGTEGPSLTGPVDISAQMLDVFGNAESLEVEDIARQRVMFRSDMKGTGAARIAFQERCGI